MPLQLIPLKAHPVIVIKLIGQITIEDIQSLIEQSNQLIDTYNEYVYFVTDTTQLEKIIFHLSDVSLLHTETLHPKFGWSIIITTNPVFRFLGSMTTQLLATNRLKVVNSIDNAIEFLKDLSPQLINLSLADFDR